MSKESILSEARVLVSTAEEMYVHTLEEISNALEVIKKHGADAIRTRAEIDVLRRLFAAIPHPGTYDQRLRYLENAVIDLKDKKLDKPTKKARTRKR